MRVLITGGGGFLGRHIAARLFEQGAEVTVLGRSPITGLNGGITTLTGDIRNIDTINEATHNQDAVVHTAAVPGIWGDRETFLSINVNGTDNVIRACRANAVKYLVHTSSPSVVFSGKDIEGADESVPYPDRYLCDYPSSKAKAEQHVLAANDSDLKTVALRPHLIWGKGDPHLVPRVIARAQKGRLVRVGAGFNRVDMIHVKNAAHAHVLALNALVSQAPVAGKCYFVSDGQPVRLWDWIDRLLRRLDIPKVTKQVSYKTAYRLGWALETLYRIAKISSEPPMTRFLAQQLAHSHYFDINRAREELGYEPLVKPEQGLDELCGSIRPGS